MKVWGDTRGLASDELSQFFDGEYAERHQCHSGLRPQSAEIEYTNFRALGRPVFPMDTHIFRILRRVGLLPEKISDELAHDRIEKLIQPKKHYSLHINLIALGRRICHPRNPKCEFCPLNEHCDFGRSQL